MNDSIKREHSSFRDPSGFLFEKNHELFRQINHSYKLQYDKLIDSGLYDSLIEKNLLLPHDEVEIIPPEPDKSYKIIKPQRINFISYPYEWSFSQLKDAALCTLEIQKIALEFGAKYKVKFGKKNIAQNIINIFNSK